MIIFFGNEGKVVMNIDKIVVTSSVLSMMLGFSCLDVEGALPRLEEQMTGPNADAARYAVGLMRKIGRDRSIGDFQLYLHQHPEKKTGSY